MEPEAYSPPVARARVLVVDDHPSTAVTLARAISQLGQGIEVISATSGEMALEQVKDRGVDLVITDLMMPNMNGLELIEKLRSHPGGSPSYTILITAYDVPGLRESARRLKVNETILKPVRPETICQTVSKVMKRMGRVPEIAPDTDIRPAKILIADDNPDNITLMLRYMQHEGYRCITAINGVDALIKTRAEKPDLLLLDVNMPEKDGFVVLQELRADPVTEFIPIIIFTAARLQPDEIEAGLSLGADDYITKPFDRRELFARIRTRLRVKRAQDTMRYRNQELTLLLEISNELHGSLLPGEIASILLTRSMKKLGANQGSLLLLNSVGELSEKYQEPSTESMELERLVSGELLNQIKEKQQGVLIEDTQQEARFPSAAGASIRSALVVPLMDRQNFFGILALAHEQEDWFTFENLHLLQAISNQASYAFERARSQVDEKGG
jgi:CheY-like chemotaxis protein